MVLLLDLRFLRFEKMSKSIQELREALQRQTQETMKLQEEATKFSSDSMSRREGASSPSVMANPSLSASFTSSRNPPSPSTRSAAMESSVCSASDAVGGSPPKMYSNHELDVESQKKPPKYSGNKPTETILKEYSQQVRNLQKRLSEATEQHEQQTFTLRQTIIELQTSLRDTIKEKDSIMDLRRRESQTQEDLNCKMKTSLSDLQTANQIQEEMLKEANNQIEHLKMMLQGHDDVLQELQNVLTVYEKNSGKKIYEPESVSSLHVCSLPTALSKLLQELEAIVSHLRGRVALLEEQLEIMEKESQSKTETLLQQHQESLERLIGEHERELEALSESVSASHSHARSVQSQMEIIQEQSKNQSSLYTRQISQLEGTVSQLRSELREARRMSQDKIEDLEKQLHLAHSQIAETQSERDQYSQETGNLDDQVQHLMAELHKKELELSLETEQNKRLWDRDTGSSITIDHLRRELDNKNMELQRMDSLVKSMKQESEEQMERQMSAIREKNESVEKVASLAAQQESTKDTLRQVVEELTEKKTRLEAAERQVAELTSRLQEKEKVIESTNEEIEKLHGRVDGKLEELQQLKKESEHLRSVQSECESLKIQLMEKEKVIEILQKQIENMTQIVDQHGRAVGAMETEKSHLLKDMNEKKLELHELKILQDKKDSKIRELEASLSEMELERVKLMNANSETLRVIKEMTLEREELVTEVRAGRIELATLAEESEAIRTDYREKTEEMEAMVSKLKLQLKSAQIELEQTRGTLKTMEGSDGHAMKVAMGMQKQITAKRGQIDALQSKIQFLEDAMASATKEKHYLKEERNKLCRELSCVAALNNKMSGELETLKAQDKRLKEKLATVEAALDKASMQFAECQCIMQQQEQEIMRCKLQHKLDVKELQGPGYALGISSLKSRYSALPYSHPSSASASQSFAGHISQVSSRSSSSKEDPLRDLKLLLQELRSTVDEIPSVILTERGSDHDTDSVLEGASSLFDRTSRECIGRRAHETYSREAAVRDLPSDSIAGQDTFGREPSTLHSADLEDHESTLPFTSSVPQAIFSSTPRYTSSKKLSPEERNRGRSPVHFLLTSSPDDLTATSASSLERRSCLKKSCSPEAATSAAARNISFSASSFMHTEEANGNTCRKLQNKMESLQNRVETMQLKNQAMSTMIRCQEKKIEQAKEKEKKLSK